MSINSGFELGNVAWHCAGVTGQFATDTRNTEPLLALRWSPGQSVPRDELDPIWRHQYINELINSGAFSHPVQLIRSGGETVGLTPWFDGLPLSTILLSAPLSLDSILDLLIEVSVSLHSIHVVGGVHGHLGLDSILWSPVSRRIRFCDSGFLSLPELPDLTHPDAENRSKMLYASPEATGRMGQSVDERLVHAHLARAPSPPCEINLDISAVLSNITMRLLSKLPEDRYRSAKGLLRDLKRCRKEFKKSSIMPNFELGLHDMPARFRPTEKLFGRLEESALLERTYEGCKNNNRSVVLVSGYAGIGKTSLVLGLRRHVIEDGGLFVSAKFEQGLTQQPLSGIRSLVRQLSENILALPEQQMDVWRIKIRNELGASATVLAGISPALKLLLQMDNTSSHISSGGARSRLVYALECFINLFSTPSSPLVLFFDDMQWMDVASTDILKYLLGQSRLTFVLIAAAYRENELQKISLANKLVEIAIKNGAHHIRLEALSESDIHSFLEECIGDKSLKSSHVAKLLLQKTGGNPFFFRTLAATFDRDKLITFDQNNDRWSFNLEAMEQVQVSEQIAYLLAARLHAYPLDCQRVLRDLACLGGSVSLDLLALVTERTSRDCLRILATPLAEGIVIRLKRTKRSRRALS